MGFFGFLPNIGQKCVYVYGCVCVRVYVYIPKPYTLNTDPKPGFVQRGPSPFPVEQ